MRFVTEHRDRFGVEPILWVLEIPVSTFYGWVGQQRDPCQRRRQDTWLLVHMCNAGAMRSESSRLAMVTQT